MNIEEALTRENSFWKAAQNRDAEGFLQIVSAEAVMVCGGYRCLGKDYARIIGNFDCKSYTIDCFEIVCESTDAYQVHYIVRTEAEYEQNRDLEGTFHVTTTWQLINGSYKAVFNMDQRIL